MSNINVKKIITVTLWLMVVAILSIFYQLYIEKKEPTYTIIEEEASFKIPETIKKPKALIHISGAVLKPGLYEVEVGKRTIDILKEAGGVLVNANLDKINLAKKVKDGQRIFVPIKKNTSKQRKSISAPQRLNEKININTANTKQLAQLKGVGPSLAQRIIHYRSHHGPFKTIEGLRKVKGIGPKLVARIQSEITH